MQNVAAPQHFWRASLVYFLGNFLSKLALFFMLPLYTACIPVADMGVYDATTAIAVLVSSLIFLDVGVGVMRFYLERGSSEERLAVLRCGLFMLLVLSALYLLLGGILCVAFAPAYAPLVVLYGLLNALFLACGMIVRAQGHTAWYATTGVISTLLQIACNLVLILCFARGFEALYISYAVGAGVGVILLLARCRINELLHLRSLDLAVLQRLLRFCLPLGIGSVAYWMLTSLGRVLVTVLVGEAAGGVFAVSLKFAQIIVFASLCFRLAWQEIAFAKGYQSHAVVGEQGGYYSEKADLFIRVTLAVCLLSVPAARVGLWLFPGFIDASYGEARLLIPAALVGAALTVLCDFLEPMFGAAKKTGILLLSTALGAMLNVALALLFIQCGGGALGAHVAFCIAVFGTVLLRVLFLRCIVGLCLRPFHIVAFPLVAATVFAYHYLSAAWNIGVLLAAVVLVFLMLPEVRLLIKKMLPNKSTK